MVKPAKRLSPLDLYSASYPSSSLSETASAPPPPPPPLKPVPAARFKGVRMRSWGRWVSEIRVPHSRDKIWLGSYSTAAQAARAYDAATIILRGQAGVSFLNLPDSAALIPSLAVKSGASPRTVQSTAANVANSYPVESHSAPDQPPQLPPAAPVAPLQLPTPPLTPGARWFQELLCMISPKENTTTNNNLNNNNNNISTTTSYFNSVAMNSSNILAGVPARTSSGGPQLQFCCDDIFHAFEMDGLAQDGFTAMSAAVTTCERFDKDIGRFELDGSLWDISNDSSSHSV